MKILPAGVLMDQYNMPKSFHIMIRPSGVLYNLGGIEKYMGDLKDELL
jgi:hypothetical protein